MAKMTVLDIVQDILSDMESDEVNSISDTTESLQVAQILRTTYIDLMTRRYQPHLRSLFKLEATSSSTPSHMRLPVALMEMERLSYDKRTLSQTDPKLVEIPYKEPSAFLSMVNVRNSDLDDVTLILDPSGVNLKIVNDSAPSYWTSFDEEYIIFDSYDSAIESNLQNSKTQVLGYLEPSLVLSDAEVPNIPSEAFPLLLSEAKRHCLAKLKQVDINDTSYREEVLRSKKQTAWLQRKKWRASEKPKYPNYGRN